MKKLNLIIFSVILFSGCANLPKSLYDDFTDNEINIKYPVILVHGILASDRSRYIHFWGRIPYVLENNGVQVFMGNTDALGSIASNAEVLKTTVDRVLTETNSEKVNIIAHSKGGLDSRYLIWKYDYGDRIASLTTVSTPHHGAELADLADSSKIKQTRIADRAFRLFGRLFGDENPDTHALIYELTTDYSVDFNEMVTVDERVFYQSIYSTMKNAFDDMTFFFTYRYIKKRSGANDGIVAEESAIWSGNTTRIERMSHTEIVDRRMRKISGVHVPQVFLGIVKELGEMGF